MSKVSAEAAALSAKGLSDLGYSDAELDKAASLIVRIKALKARMNAVIPAAPSSGVSCPRMPASAPANESRFFLAELRAALVRSSAVMRILASAISDSPDQTPV